MTDTVWVLYRVAEAFDGDEDRQVIICGTVFLRSDANRWSDGHPDKGAICVPLDGLAKGEVW